MPDRQVLSITKALRVRGSSRTFLHHLALPVPERGAIDPFVMLEHVESPLPRRSAGIVPPADDDRSRPAGVDSLLVPLTTGVARFWVHGHEGSEDGPVAPAPSDVRPIRRNGAVTVEAFVGDLDPADGAIAPPVRILRLRASIAGPVAIPCGPHQWNVLMYVARGGITVGGCRVGAKTLVSFGPAGDRVRFDLGVGFEDDEVEVLMAAGEPTGLPSPVGWADLLDLPIR